MAISIMLCFARSGGTLLNKCIGSLPNVVMLSEVNPLGGGWGVLEENSYTTVQSQAKHWYGIDLASEGYVQGILELDKICQGSRKHLVIRDWSFVNFSPREENNFSPPNRFLTLDALSGRTEIHSFGFVRDSIDVWISRGMPELEDFFQQYNAYLDALLSLKVPIFKYEQFCKNPRQELQKICDYTGIHYSEMFWRYASFEKVNGDVQVKNGSRGTKQGRIAPLPRRTVSDVKVAALNRCKGMKRANELTGYPQGYLSLDTRHEDNIDIAEADSRRSEMEAQKMHNVMVRRWFKDNGDKTHRLNYPLSEDSVVFDVGGYKGNWAQKIAEKYNPNVFIFEPIPQFYDSIVERFKENPKASVFNFGLLDQTIEEKMSFDNDKSSIFKSETTSTTKVHMIDIDQFLKDYGIERVDLMKINIEGAEFRLLQRMIDKKIIEKCENIQVQFHVFQPNAMRLWAEIRRALQKTHSLTYDYPFVWENWKKGHIKSGERKSPLVVEDDIKKGEIAFTRGDLDEAEYYFLKTLASGSNQKEAYNNLGVIAFQKNNVSESVDYLTKALQIDPSYKDALLNYSEVLAGLGVLTHASRSMRNIAEKAAKEEKYGQRLYDLGQGRSDLKIAILCLPGFQSFLGNIVSFLKDKYQVQTCYSNSLKEIVASVEWADVVWLEWANELAVRLTNHPSLLSSKFAICRLHSYEAFSSFIEQIKWEKIDEVVFVAEHIRETVIQRIPRLSYKARHMHVIPNAIDLHEFPFTQRKKGNNLAFLGNINYKKGPMLLLHAFRELVQCNREYRLFIGGSFQDERYALYYKQMIHELKLGQNIQIDGFIDDVGGWLEDKQYIVCSSVLEGHPVGLMEAMACGVKPVIHNFVGAKGIYPSKYLWSSIPDFVQRMMEDEYDSMEYRRFIEDRFPLNRQLQKIDEIVNGVGRIEDSPAGNVELKMRKGAEGSLPSAIGVTAVIAVRNGSRTIERAIDSLLCQTLPMNKIVVVDDCSDDDTVKIVERYVAGFGQKVELIKLSANHWVYRARNHGFERVETEFFFFLDADDFVFPSYSEKLTTILRENPRCAFAYSDMVYFNGSKESQAPLPDFESGELMKRNFIPYSAMIRSSDFKALGGYDNYLNDSRNHLSEWDLWLRFASAGKVGKHIPEFAFYYYQADEQMSKNYERTRGDMLAQMALNRGASVTLGPENTCRLLLVCQGRDYLDRSKVGFEVYTWLKPLAEFGEVFTFFYDVELEHFGQDRMIRRLLSLIEKVRPNYVFHPAYKEHIPIEIWKEISKTFITIAWFSDDNWRFDSYSCRYCKGFRFAVTTYPEVLGKYTAIGYDNVLLSQWAANTVYFRDYGLPRDINVSFCGQRYGDRVGLMEGLGVQCFGKGWSNGMLQFPEMARVLNRSRISLNFSKGADGRFQMKLRPFEIAASNTLVLCEKVDELEKYYAIGKEVVVFENKTDLKQKIVYYLEHEEERREIARAGYERTMWDHRWHNRLDEIFEGISRSLAIDERGTAAAV